MLNLNGLDIEISRGDTGTIRITFVGSDIPEDGTIGLFSVKDRPDRDEVIWEKQVEVVNGGCEIALTTEETSIGLGLYRWDLRLFYEDGAVYTPMKPARFLVSPVVGNLIDSNEDAGTEGEVIPDG